MLDLIMWLLFFYEMLWCSSPCHSRVMGLCAHGFKVRPCWREQVLGFILQTYDQLVLPLKFFALGVMANIMAIAPDHQFSLGDKLLLYIYCYPQVICYCGVVFVKYKHLVSLSYSGILLNRLSTVFEQLFLLNVLVDLVMAILSVRIREHPLGVVESAVYLRTIYEYFVIITKTLLVVLLNFNSQFINTLPLILYS